MRQRRDGSNQRRNNKQCRERPSSCRAAECSQQFPPSDVDCHTPLPCEVRKGNDTTLSACSLAVQGGLRLSSASTALLPPPALGERRHHGLMRRLAAVRRRAVLVMAESEIRA